MSFYEFTVNVIAIISICVWIYVILKEANNWRLGWAFIFFIAFIIGLLRSVYLSFSV